MPLSAVSYQFWLLLFAISLRVEAFAADLRAFMQLREMTHIRF